MKIPGPARQTGRLRARPPGFTLVELLVVVAIIIVLAAIAFVVSNRAVQAAQATRCINNLKQIGAKHLDITGDNHGFFIHPSWTPMYGGPRRGWAMHFTASAYPEIEIRKWSEINDRVTTLEMLNCPTAYTRHKTEMAQHNGHARWRTYGLNTRIGSAPGQWSGGGSGEGGWITGATRPDQVEDASLLVLAGECSWNGKQFRNAFGPFNVRDYKMADHHRGGFHVVYMDGHVEWHTMETFPYPDNVLPDGRKMKWRENEPRNENEKFLSLTWKGVTYRRSMPSQPPQ
jgi:prepilin-type N-terminal cleavage/methylation domain-containing protein/prepilin-type processing-associated H-X9-DG protein